MRRRLLSSMVLVTIVAVVIFGVPLAVASARLYRGREVNKLAREATRAALVLPATGLGGGDNIELPVPSSQVVTALYDTNGKRVAGRGPRVGGTEVQAALRGRVTDDRDGAWLAVAVPLQDEETIVGSARAAVPWSVVTRAAYSSWLAMAAIGAAAIVLAAAIAWWQASRLVAPVEEVAALAVKLGSGDFAARLTPSGIAELDRAADALNRTAARLGEVIARERAFTADVSHQLNTPLTSLRLSLESALVTPHSDATAAIEQAVGEVDRLQNTVVTLLGVARDADTDTNVTCDVAAVCLDVAARHREALASEGRPLRTEIATALPLARFPAEVLQEILAVLLENARVHGAGEVTIAARPTGRGVIVDVRDEGSGITGDTSVLFSRRSPEAAGYGIGLALARSLAEAHEARLGLTRAAPRPIFTIAMPGTI